MTSSSTCGVHSCDEPRRGSSAWCVAHRRNDLRNGTPFIAADKGTSGYACAVCGAGLLPDRWADGTCSVSCTYRRALLTRHHA